MIRPPCEIRPHAARRRDQRVAYGALLALGLGGLAAALMACGSSAPGASSSAGGPADAGCTATVVTTTGHLAMHAYGDTVASDITRTALRVVSRSVPLRQALLREDGPAIRRAVAGLASSGHLVRLQLRRSGRVLADSGASDALSPLPGVVRDASGRPLGDFRLGTQSATGYLRVVEGLTGARLSVRWGRHTLAGSVGAAESDVPSHGTYTGQGTRYGVFSFSGHAFSAATVRIEVFTPLDSVAAKCSTREAQTVRNTLRDPLLGIYRVEARGGQAAIQRRRVQHDAALLAAVRHGDRRATVLAIDALLNQHVVRVRASDRRRLLADVGGPHVLAPLNAPLRFRGRLIGRAVLSIQDDMGYLLLAHRLLGVEVVMRSASLPVLSSLQPAPAGAIPDQGPFSFGGHRYEIFSFRGEAFPAGPLNIYALIPIPYR